MKQIKIQNGQRELILNFSDKDIFNEMVQAIQYCINNEEEKLINYSDKKDNIILTREYLINSLIVMPKEYEPITL